MKIILLFCLILKQVQDPVKKQVAIVEDEEEEDEEKEEEEEDQYEMQERE